MLFKRRERIGFAERVRLALWPRRSWSRSVRYTFLRLKRVPSSPHRIALGAAIGVFAVFTPFLGLQLVIAGVLAFVLRASLVASFLASFVGNPLTYPIIWLSTFNLGNVLLGATASGRIVNFRSRAGTLWESIVAGSPNAIIDSMANIWPVLKPMIVGSLPLGIFAASVAYVTVRRLTGAAHARKRQRVSLGAAPQIGS